MRTFGRIGWICMMAVTVIWMFVSCGNSQKNKVQEPVETVVEESEVVVEVDSIAPDSTNF